MSKIFSKLTNTQDGGENLPKISVWFNNFLKGYNHKKYWKRRSIVIDPNNKKNILVKIFYLIYIKRVDARHHCSFGTSLHYGAQFKTPPNFPMDQMELSLDMTLSLENLSHYIIR